MPVRRDRAEGHGFGLKSIKMIVDRFEGAMNAHVEGDVFHLDLILPLR
ncbi:MAG: ATP-binding protein [Lachnospiraceae bacterium]|nr:ATP-binding protein [Lachnospiraceae bacterium]